MAVSTPARRYFAAANTILAQLEAGREETKVHGERPVHGAVTYLRNDVPRTNYGGASSRLVHTRLGALPKAKGGQMGKEAVVA